MGLLDKIKWAKSKMTPAISVEVSSEPSMEKPMMGMEQDSINQMEWEEEQLYSDYTEEDQQAIMELWPLASVFEYLEPLLVQASDREFIEFIHDAFESRKQMLESL